MDAQMLMAYSRVDSGAVPACTPASRSRTIQASPPSRVSKLRLIRRPSLADEAQWIRFTLSVATYSRMLVALGGTSSTLPRNCSSPAELGARASSEPTGRITG
jgi:hypothetical protein